MYEVTSCEYSLHWNVPFRSALCIFHSETQSKGVNIISVAAAEGILCSILFRFDYDRYPALLLVRTYTLWGRGKMLLVALLILGLVDPCPQFVMFISLAMFTGLRSRKWSGRCPCFGVAQLCVFIATFLGPPIWLSCSPGSAFRNFWLLSTRKNQGNCSWLCFGVSLWDRWTIFSSFALCHWVDPTQLYCPSTVCNCGIFGDRGTSS